MLVSGAKDYISLTNPYNPRSFTRSKVGKKIYDLNTKRLDGRIREVDIARRNSRKE
jgi:hypothetical protein